MKLVRINSKRIKKSIICKNVNSTLVNKEIKKTYIPKAGDVAIFKVKEIGKHTRIQSVGGNNRYILPGDLIMGTFGNRYATGQMEGYVPAGYHKEYHILGQGGAIGILESMHSKFELVGPTTLTLVGYVVNEHNEIINTKNITESINTYRAGFRSKDPKIILSLGTSMDSGKTSTAAFVSRGLKLARKKVAFIKLTGTVYTKDKRLVKDYGAKIAVDFSDYGFPSTYMCSLEEILNLYKKLVNRVRSSNPDYIIVEIADGLLQRETSALIHNNKFMTTVSGVLFSSGDSMSAVSGADMLSHLRSNVLGLSGLFTASPLLIKEVKEISKYDVFTKEELMSREINSILEKKLNSLKFDDKMVVNI